MSQKHFNSLKNLKEILKQNATRWMIIKDAEEWFEGFEKKHRTIDVKAWVRTYLTEDEGHIVELANAIRLYIEKELLGETT